MSSEPQPIKVALRRTVREIAEYLSAPNPLRVLRLINVLPPRSWHFALTFDGSNRTVLTIRSEPKLTAVELFQLANGALQEMFAADVVILHDASASVSMRIPDLPDSAEDTNMLTAEAGPSQESGLLALIGYFGSKIPASLQSDSFVTRELTENTWFESVKFSKNHHRVSWNVLGKVQVYSPQDRLVLGTGTELVYRRNVALSDPPGSHLGELFLATSPRVEQNRIYHSRLGNFDPAKFTQDFWRRLNGGAERWLLEIDESRLKSGVVLDMTPAALVRAILAAVAQRTKVESQGASFATYWSEVQRQKLIQSASALAACQEKATETSRVFFRGTELLCVPGCENEVVALLCKLEVLQGIPFNHFKLLEYTPKRGIDALADFQIEAVGAIIRFGAVELEHYFENFFDRDHPVEQVHLVICWDFRDGNPPSDLPLQRKHNWLFSYSRNGYTFWVRVLSRIPNLEIRGEEGGEER